MVDTDNELEEPKTEPIPPKIDSTTEKHDATVAKLSDILRKKENFSPESNLGKLRQGVVDKMMSKFGQVIESVARLIGL